MIRCECSARGRIRSDLDDDDDTLLDGRGAVRFRLVVSNEPEIGEMISNVPLEFDIKEEEELRR